MANQKQLDEIYMGTALLHSRLSKARRAQVGAVLVTKQGVTLTGFNGTPTGLSNVCEYDYQMLKDEHPTLITKPEVIHAELNCILKAAREGVSCIDATMYVTLSPCVPCAAMMIQAGVKRLVFKDLYRDQGGIGLLLEAQVVVECYDYTQLNERK